MRCRHVIWTVLLLFTGDLAAAGIAPACERPPRPVIPDGSNATEAALLAARTALEKFLTDADDYLTCLRRFEEGLGETIAEVDGHDIVMRYNAMVDDMYLAGDEFNIALRRFKNQ